MISKSGQWVTYVFDGFVNPINFKNIGNFKKDFKWIVLGVISLILSDIIEKMSYSLNMKFLAYLKLIFTIPMIILTYKSAMLMRTTIGGELFRRIKYSFNNLTDEDKQIINILSVFIYQNGFYLSDETARLAKMCVVGKWYRRLWI